MTLFESIKSPSIRKEMEKYLNQGTMFNAGRMLILLTAGFLCWVITASMLLIYIDPR